MTIVDLASSPQPLLRMQLDAIHSMTTPHKLEFVAQEQQAWREFAVSTDHDDVAAAVQD